MTLIDHLWAWCGQNLWLNTVTASPLVPSRVRAHLCSLHPRVAARGARIEAAVLWWGSGRVTIGKGSFVNRGSQINHSAEVTIGSNVDIGPGVRILTATHALANASHRAGPGTSAAVHIEDGVWIGASVTLLPGVTVGRGSVIAAGAVVTKDCEPNRVYAGVPARPGKQLDQA